MFLLGFIAMVAASVVESTLGSLSLGAMARRLVGEIDDTKPKDERKLLTTLYALRRIIILVTVTGLSVYILSQIQLFESMGLSILASASVLAVLVGAKGRPNARITRSATTRRVMKCPTPRRLVTGIKASPRNRW